MAQGAPSTDNVPAQLPTKPGYDRHRWLFHLAFWSAFALLGILLLSADADAATAFVGSCVAVFVGGGNLWSAKHKRFMQPMIFAMPHPEPGDPDWETWTGGPGEQVARGQLVKGVLALMVAIVSLICSLLLFMR